MPNEQNNKKVICRKASDNKYMHKDFHGALCYALKYLNEQYDPEAVKEYLQQVALTYFKPLTEKLKTQGLKALEDHWQNIFTQENGKFDLSYEDDTLVLKVTRCPAIEHLKEKNMLYTDSYCMTTTIVNKTICHQAGYDCSCQYNTNHGKCIQKFWKIKGD